MRRGLAAVLRDFEHVVGPTYGLALMAATFFVPFGLLARRFARSRVRAGDHDPLERPRAWVKRHATLALGLVALPAMTWAVLLRYALQHFNEYPGSLTLERFAFLFVVAFAGMTMLGRAGLRAVLAPTLGAGDADAPPALARDEIVFSAMAVTRETRAAVAVSFASIILALLVVVAAPRTGVALALFPALLAAVYSRASRIAVGIDGVLIKGTSRTRFFAYRAFDDVRLRIGDVVLVRGGETVLRLQLHGDDAARRDAIVTRIREALARVSKRRAHPTEEFVQSATPAQISGAVAGAVDFRLPPLSREALWEIVEGSTVDADAREAAAKALARAFDEPERARLRIAAAQCAEPRLRVALEALDEDSDEAVAEPGVHAAPARVLP
jgi:hypothetical protein